MLRIRLSRRGAKKDPHYRVVVSDQKSKRDGRFVEIIGNYSPAMKPVQLNLDLERVQYWVGQGAQPTETVRTLIRRARTAEAESPLVVAVEPEKVETVGEAAEKVEAPAEAVTEESSASEAEEPGKA